MLKNNSGLYSKLYNQWRAAFFPDLTKQQIQKETNKFWSEIKHCQDFTQRYNEKMNDLNIHEKKKKSNTLLALFSKQFKANRSVLDDNSCSSNGIYGSDSPVR